MDNLIKIKKEFYKKCIENLSIYKDTKMIKKEYFNETLTDGKLYKYIPFDNNENLNSLKLQTIRNKQLWFAAGYTLRDNDPTEFKINVNLDKASLLTTLGKNGIRNILETCREINDVCCLSDRLNNQMWIDYANTYSGCCCVFTIDNYEMLWPVIYCNKVEADFTEEFVNSIKGLNDDNLDLKSLATLSVIVPVLKDEQKYEYEHEIRLLCSDVYDSYDDALGGHIAAGRKEEIRYKGTTYSYEKCGLNLEKIFIGKNTNTFIKNQIKLLNPNIEIEEYKR